MLSIVMPHYNRSTQLIHTLKRIEKTKETDFEIIVVDDFSSEEHSIVDVPKIFPNLNLKIISLRDRFENKWYRNPCIPYNIGFRESVGDTVIIQNPECCHIGDVIGYVKENLTDENYLVFHCYWTNPEDTTKLQNFEPIEYADLGFNQDVDGIIRSKWAMHQKFRRMPYNYTSAITRKNLKILNGFDEGFALGHCAEDDDLLLRIRNLNLNITYVEEPHVIHQYHPIMYNDLKPLANNREYWDKVRTMTRIRVENSLPIE